MYLKEIHDIIRDGITSYHIFLIILAFLESFRKIVCFFNVSGVAWFVLMPRLYPLRSP